MRPLLVATIQRSPQRTIEVMFPTPGTVLPRVAFQTPLGPCSVTVPLLTSRTVHPSMVVGLVSGTGTGLAETFVRSTAVSPGGRASCFVAKTRGAAFARIVEVSSARTAAGALVTGLFGKPDPSRPPDLTGGGGDA